MIKPSVQFYGPALRMKGGELLGLRNLAPDIADRVIPRFIVPPPAERDNELQDALFSSDTFPDISASLTAHWAQRPAMVEFTYLMDEFGRDRMGLWLPKMFERARNGEAYPIPLVTLNNLLLGDIAAYRAAIDSSVRLKFAIVLSSGDMADNEMIKRAIDRLAKLGLSAEECAMVADFHDADFADPEVVAPIIAGTLDTIQTAGHWQQIIFQGTNYPEQNPAQPGSHCIVPRNEWISWRRAISFDPSTAETLMFGDYAADCAKIKFGGGGGTAPIRHYRYTTPECWLVQRGPDSGSNVRAMREICSAIVSSGEFAGRNFSSADDHIFRVSEGLGNPGGAREWRAINTTHHITRVVTDIGNTFGVSFSRKELEPVGGQMSFLRN